MNHQHCVPEFDMDEFYSAPTSSGQSRQMNIRQEDDDIMELVWHDGQIGALNQNRRLFPKSSPPLKPQQNHQEELHYHHPPSDPTVQPPPMPESASTTHLFMQEDEMTSWLHYPLDDASSFDPHLTNLLYQPPGPSTPLHPLPADSQSRPPPASPSAPGVNFPHFARLKNRVPESGEPERSKNNDLRELTVEDSSGTPALRPNSPLFPESRSVGGAPRTSMTVGSVSGAMATADLMTQPPVHDRKRKGKVSADAATTKIHSEDLGIESFTAKKQYRGTEASGKRSRASEVHNLSERRRRDRINEKMKALQELIPSCSKTDKASMLDEAIEYLKSLQTQVQMLSMGYTGMVPMVLPGTQQYIHMPPMRLGMGIETGICRSLVQFPAVLTGSPMATPGAQSLMGPRFPFPMLPAVESFDPSRIQSNQMVSIPNENVPQGAIVVKMPGDSYQQFLGARQMHAQQIPQPQNPQISTPTTSQPITITKAEENENHPNVTGLYCRQNQSDTNALIHSQNTLSLCSLFLEDSLQA